MNGVVIIILSLGPDPGPEVSRGQSCPQTLCRQTGSRPLAASSSVPTASVQLVRAGVEEDAGGGTQEAVQEVTDGSREGCGFDVLSEGENHGENHGENRGEKFSPH